MSRLNTLNRRIHGLSSRSAWCMARHLKVVLKDTPQKVINFIGNKIVTCELSNSQCDVCLGSKQGLSGIIKEHL